MEDIVQHTHHMPKVWRDKLHTLEVLGEFTQLFQYKIVAFAIELISVLLAPFILIFSLPHSSDKIIQFFREFTVTEEGVGDICKFAVFPLGDHGSRKYGVESNSTKRMQTKQGKMEKSFLNFKANNPDWKPSEQGEKYLVDLGQTIHTSLTGSQRNIDDSQNDFNNHSNPDPTLFLSTFSRERQQMQESTASLEKINRKFFRETNDPDYA